jgi:hypothetical protein
LRCLIAITCSTARADDAGCPHPSQAQIENLGAYHPLANDPSVKTVSFAWRF